MQRRDFLRYTGGATAGSMIGLAGCVGDDGNGNGDGDGDFPSESLTWMIPWSEGGGTDTYARQLAPLMEEPLGESIEIDNRPGAGSLVGSEWLHQQDNDGHTFGTVNTPGWEFTWRVEEVEGWDPADFEPISYSGVFGYTIIANDSHGIEDFADLQDAYDAGEIDNFAYQGVGSDSHMISLLLRDEYDLNWGNIVPYDGGGPVNEAVISDEVPAGIATNTSAGDAVESGNVSAIVNLMDIDLPAFPEIDQITNYGDSLAYITEFRQTQVAPPDTPEDVRQELSEAVEVAATSDEAQEWAEETGNVLEYGDLEEAREALEGTVEELEENVDFEEFQQQVEEEDEEEN
jgi:tripartite-type tricarboxylate transporter receptor subunit TctC